MRKTTLLLLASMTLAVLLACTTTVLMAAQGVAQTTTEPVTLVGAGDIAECSPDNNAKATAALLASIPGTVLSLGDNAYPDGTRTQYANCYDNYRLSDGSIFDATRTSWWGQYKARMMPVVGNHEYHISKVAQPYFDYFSALNGFKQPRAPVPNTSANPGLTPGKGYYSYDKGSWHIVALNSNCNKVGGCEKTSTQGKWLQKNLANTNKQCTLAYFHEPLFSTGNNIPNPNVKPLWQILYNNGADVIVNGHAHRYERYAPLTPAGKIDQNNGIRQIVAGTG